MHRHDGNPHAIQPHEGCPTPAEYANLRHALGFGRLSPEEAERTLSASRYALCLRAGGELAGVLRILGDGLLYLFIADVFVHPDHAGRGLGTTLMEAAVAYIGANAHPLATVTLVPMAGREPFYERFGFVRCPNQVFGAGMAYLRHLELEG